MAMEYQGFATLGVNLNRQKYGPLDVSSVFTSAADLTYYITKGKVKEETLSDYWKDIVPYPYEGQIVSLVADGAVSVLKLVADGDIFKTEPLMEEVELPDNIATQEFVQEEINKIEIPSTEGFATEEFVENKIAGLEIGSGQISMEALTEAEILAIIGSTTGGTPVTPSGQVLTEMSADDVRKIINT